MTSSVEEFEMEKIKTLRNELDSSQKKAFTKWVNATLKKANLEINDLFQDLTDGKILIKLLEILSGEKLGRPSEGIFRVQKADNINKCLDFLKTKVNIGSIGAEDIMDGNQRLTLGLIWMIILRLHVNEIETEVVEDEENAEKQSATDSLLLWCQRVTAGYPGVKITNFSNSWRNGLGFNALIHAHRPDLIVFEDLDPDDHVGNLNTAFEVASEKLGISKILDADDVDVPKPDEKVIITYVASFYHYFPHIKREITEPVKGFKKSTKASDAAIANLDQESQIPPTTFILSQHKTDNDEEVPPHSNTPISHPKPSMDTIDRQVLQTADDHALQVSKSDHSSLKHLIWDLIDSKNITDELEKCRVIFRWLASTNLKEMSFENVQPDSPEEVLLGLKTEQATYARVFDTICNCAGLSSKIIHGYVKGVKYRPGEKFQPGSNRHSWNAVCIYDTWCLIDAKWGARSIIGKPTTTEELYELDEYYFLTEPGQLIFSHFPDDPNWQLLEKQVTLEEFVNMPYVNPTFFKYGLKFVSNGVAVVHARGEISISLRYPTNRIDLAFIFTIQLESGDDEYKGVKLNRYGIQESVGGLSSCRLRLPEKGSYKLYISAKEEAPENKPNVYARVCELKIVQEEVNSPQPKPFPPCAYQNWGPGAAFFRHGLTTELQKATVVTRDGKAELQFKIPKPMQFMTTLRSNRRSDSELEGYCISWIVDDKAYFSITAPGRGEYALEIYATDPSAEDNNFLYIAKYLIECNDDVTAVPPPKLPEGYLGAQPQFLEFGIKTQSHNNPVIDIENNNVDIMLTTSQEMQVTADLIDARTDQAFPEFVFVQNREFVVSFIATLPAVGFYKFQLHSIPINDGGQHLPNVYNYLINCKKITQQPCPFPKQYVRWKRGCYMEAPLILHPNSGDEVMFRVIIPKATSVEVKAAKEGTKLLSPQPAVFEGRVRLAGLYGTDATVTLRATFGDDSKSYTTLLKYRI